MSRRLFLRNLLLLGATIGLPTRIAHAQVKLQDKHKGKLLQTSPVAGFQYHQGEVIWTKLSKGAVLQLIREPENKHDDRAVRVDFNGQKLGYIPKLDNAAISQLLDRGERLETVIVKLQQSDNPWDRVGVEVRWMI